MRTLLLLAVTIISSHATAAQDCTKVSLDGTFRDYVEAKTNSYDLIDSQICRLESDGLLKELPQVEIGLATDLLSNYPNPQRRKTAGAIPAALQCESIDLVVALLKVSGTRTREELINSELCYVNASIATSPELGRALCGFRTGLLLDKQKILESYYEVSRVAKSTVDENKALIDQVSAECGVN
jgi:hypothetical protein